jgi:hypothetical protein
VLKNSIFIKQGTIVKEKMEKEEDIKIKHNPEVVAGFFSKITFWYLQPLLKLGYQRPLELVIN